LERGEIHGRGPANSSRFLGISRKKLGGAVRGEKKGDEPIRRAGRRKKKVSLSRETQTRAKRLLCVKGAGEAKRSLPVGALCAGRHKERVPNANKKEDHLGA